MHIYAGDRSARAILELGLSVDRATKNQRVCVVQFLGNAGQAASIESLHLPVPIDICKCETEEQLAEACSALGGSDVAKERLAQAREVLKSGGYDVVVLAEATTAIACRYISVQDIAELIDQRSPDTEAILTGSCVEKAVAELADTVTELVPTQVKVDVVDRLGLEYWRAEEDVLDGYVPGT